MDIMTVFPRRPSLENVQKVQRQCKGPYQKSNGLRYFNLINQRLEQCVHASTLHGWSLIECQITIWTWSWTGDVQIARTYILFSFTKERGELTIMTTKHGLLGSFTTRKVCFLTINYGQNEFAELQIGKFIFWHHSHLTSYTEDFFSYHNS